MTSPTREPSPLRLDPQDRIAETLFGLIMVLTFTGSFSVAGAGRDDVRAMLVAALGCNIAWGIIDSILYLMALLTERTEEDRLLRTVQAAADPAQAHRALLEAVPAPVASALGPEILESVRTALRRLPAPPERRRLHAADFARASGVFLWVVASVFPVAVPFLLVSDPARALRISNAVAVLLLFVAGFAYGRLTRHHGWATGLVMVALGLVLVGLTIALGG